MVSGALYLPVFYPPYVDRAVLPPAQNVGVFVEFEARHGPWGEGHTTETDGRGHGRVRVGWQRHMSAPCVVLLCFVVFCCVLFALVLVKCSDIGLVPQMKHPKGRKQHHAQQGQSSPLSLSPSLLFVGT